MLRVKSGPECPEGNLRELTGESNPNCGIAPEREGKGEREQERENYPVKCPNLRHCQGRSQNKGLSEYQRRASQLQTSPSPARDKQAGGSQSWKGAIAAPERHPPPNCKQAPLLTKNSWDSGRLTSTGRVALRDQLSEGMPEKVHPLYTQKAEQLGQGRW